MNTKQVEIVDIERLRLDLPLQTRNATTWQIRAGAWSVFDLFKVTLGSGAVGVGETTVNYTWSARGDAMLETLKGRNAIDLMWDDALGAGLQMALFDAAGQTLGVPIHRLLGRQHRDACPVSWWAQDMPPQGWALEAQTAEQHGFTSLKVKARPWFDIDAQLQAVCDAVSPHFKIDTDFNGLLMGVDVAAPLICRLEEKYHNLAIVESPIPQADVAGNVLLRSKIRSPIAMHIGDPPVMTAIREGVCDGFVIGGGATAVMKEGAVAEAAGMPFWLQMVGSGLTTMFSVHLGAVLKQARWPAIPCINILEENLLKSFVVEGGCVAVPQAPGLGVELDWEAIDRFRVAPDYEKPTPRQIHTIHWADGHQSHYPDGGYRGEFLEGKIIGFQPGIWLDYRLDDGSDEFDKEYGELFPS